MRSCVCDACVEYSYLQCLCICAIYYRLKFTMRSMRAWLPQVTRRRPGRAKLQGETAEKHIGQ